MASTPFPAFEDADGPAEHRLVGHEAAARRGELAEGNHAIAVHEHFLRQRQRAGVGGCQSVNVHADASIVIRVDLTKLCEVPLEIDRDLLDEHCVREVLAKIAAMLVRSDRLALELEPMSLGAPDDSISAAPTPAARASRLPSCHAHATVPSSRPLRRTRGRARRGRAWRRRRRS